MAVEGIIPRRRIICSACGHVTPYTGDSSATPGCARCGKATRLLASPQIQIHSTYIMARKRHTLMSAARPGAAV